MSPSDVARRLREHALSLPGAWPDSPWSDGHDVAKVGPGERGKIFAFLGEDTVGVKCAKGRDEADEWLERYPDDARVMAYIGRHGWNTLRTGGAIPVEELLEAVGESYALVLAGLASKDRPTA